MDRIGLFPIPLEQSDLTLIDGRPTDATTKWLTEFPGLSDLMSQQLDFAGAVRSPPDATSVVRALIITPMRTQLQVYQASFKEREAVLGAIHPQVAVSLDNWAQLAGRKNFELARRLLARALGIRLFHKPVELSEEVRKELELVAAGPTTEEFDKWKADFPQELPARELQSLEMHIASNMYSMGCLLQNYGHFAV